MSESTATTDTAADDKSSGFQVVVPLTNEKIGDQIITAFEGGITYWCRSVALVSPAIDSVPDDPKLGRVVWWGRSALYEGEFDILVTEDEPQTEGASPDFHLNRESVQRGVNVMASKFPHHFADVVTESGDATTADVFIQCCLFGDLVYG